MRDVFYYGAKPNVHPRERPASNLDDARYQSMTEHFWIINEFCDYENFDWDFAFEFLPDEDVWAEEHNNIWPSQHQRDSGTWLCAKEYSDIIIYRSELDPIKRKNEIHSNWVEYEKIDHSKFDFSWHPDPSSPPYIYKWGCKFFPVELKPCLEYHVEGATDIKYMDTIVELLPEWDKWLFHQSPDPNKFDFSWRPDPRDPPYIYVWGNKWIDGTLKPTVEYYAAGATEKKYVPDHIKVLPEWELWEELYPVDHSKFDFSWRPDPREPPFIYQFPSQWSRTGGPRFVVEGATEVNYIDAQTAIAKPDKTHWVVPDDIETTDFDFSWHPDIEDKPYVYQFGTQWQKTGGPKFIAHDATLDSEIKYIDATKAKALPNVNFWKTLIATDTFDYSWHPDTTEEPFIYVFGNQWFDAITEPTIEYRMPGATQRKYIADVVAKTAAAMNRWETLVPVENFDYTWRPHPDSPPYIYVWGNQWNNCFVEPTIRYVVEGATEYQYMENAYACVASTEEENHWEILIPISKFDFSWRPDPSEPPFIYVFGNKWNSAEKEPTIIYRLEGATEYKFVDAIIATPQVNFTNWTIRNSSDRKCFDFSWRPDPSSKSAIYEWGDDGPVYTVPDATETINIEYDISLREIEELVIEELVEVIQKEVSRPMFFVDRGNIESNQRYNQLKERFPQLQKTRYLNSWVETITRCCSRSEKELFWILNSELDYDDFKFDYNPNPWQMKMIHVFGTQWTHWGNTYLINKNTFKDDTKYVKVIDHLNVLNFVKDRRAKATNCLYDVVLINHGNKENVEETIKDRVNGKSIITIDYKTSYLKTFKEVLNKLNVNREHYIWICSSVCDYSEFDFSYICDPFAKDQLHVFPSEGQKQGDTFLVNVNRFRELIGEMTMLEDYEKINYNQHQRVRRLPEPIIVTNDAYTHIDAAKDYSWDFPYVTLVAEDNKDLDNPVVEPMSLWTPDTKSILVTSTGATRMTVPREVKHQVEYEMYDYPYIKRSSKLAKSKPIDIVYLSNGETGADKNWEHLLQVTKGRPNRVVRVDGVNGRVAAYHAAASASETPWMFTVFAKLTINPKFDWDWQPDRMQAPKHYIFNAKNPVNGLIYGHQAMIAYHKNLVLNNQGHGLDFTLDDLHEVVPLLSGTANYNTDPFSTWRTSFREVVKLKAEDTDIARERLDAWMNKGEGDFAEYSIQGAQNAAKYYDEVNGDFDALRLSYEWAWLKERFVKEIC